VTDYGVDQNCLIREVAEGLLFTTSSDLFRHPEVTGGSFPEL
jgi:hypothetical protein